MKSHKEQLMSLELFCSCSPRFTRMQASEYESGTRIIPETVIYRCALCGKSKIVVREPEVVSMSALRHAVRFRVDVPSPIEV
jgi:hypothetical protein